MKPVELLNTHGRARPAAVFLAALMALVALPGLAAQAPEAEEPALALPTYVLEIQDLRTETVEAGLPKEQDLLPPERTPPLPRAGELVVREPSIILAPPQGDASAAGTEAQSFFVEGTVGAGTLHRLVSQLAVYRPGAEPRAKLAFNYDMMDGFGGHDAGAGYHVKTDSLEGGMELASGSVNLSATGAFSDADVGLQGQSGYTARIRRATDATVDATWDVSRLLRLSGGLAGSATALLLTRQAPDVMTQYELSPRIGAELTLGPVKAGLDLAYTLGVTEAASVSTLHWLEPSFHVGADLPLALTAAATVGWHYRVGGTHFVPWSVSVTGAPVDPLWIRFAGGFRVTDLSRGASFSVPYSQPPVGELQDTTEWYGGALARLSIGRSLLVSAGVDFALVDGMLTAAAAADPLTGLYPVEQLSAKTLSATAGLRWDVTSTVSARVDYRGSFLDRPRFSPTHSATLDVSFGAPSGRFGGGVSGRFDVVPERTPALQIPRLDANGFFRFSPHIKAQAEVTDALLPLTLEPRVGVPPYIEPGFGATLRFLVSL